MWQLLNSISSKSGSLTATTARTVTTPFDLCAAKSLIPRSTLGCKKKPAPREHLRDVSVGGSHWWCVFHSTSLNPLLGCTASVSLATSFHWKWHEFKLTAGTIFYQTANFFFPAAFRVWHRWRRSQNQTTWEQWVFSFSIKFLITFLYN